MDIHRISRVEQKKTRRQWRILAVLFFLLCGAMLFALNTGYVKLTPFEVIKTFLGMGTEKQALILFEFRLSRIIVAMLVGAGLAVSGCILQGISRNPLADPGIIGITTGAGLFVIVFVAFYDNVSLIPTYIVPIFAFLGGAITAAVIYVLSYRRHEGLLPTRLILTGVAIAAALNGLMMVLVMRLNPKEFHWVSVWLSGTIWGYEWKHVIVLFPLILLFIVAALWKSKLLDVLSLGDQISTGFGVTLEKERIILLAIAVGLAASSVSVSGGIAFVGLIAPHIARRLIGPYHQYLVPASALIGGIMLVVADTIGRSIIAPSEIQAGIVVAIIGAPYFLYLLSRTKV
ncbi:FecCD family ABC transporter permease [Longirhabdus pacifica]|uniref:FecCD family ABC transporter permease n=1 Tax=Longirhabdus pacifica TaxID=2305227 RepID=UPI001008D087|nr:iron ABC transporter permease [Longirhabdus pacifica]